jgi:hypothetical protein
MATLEMVSLRAKLPTGRLTLRHAVPVLNPVRPEDLLGEIPAASETTATPEVGAGTGTRQRAGSETVARKGGTAR